MALIDVVKLSEQYCQYAVGVKLKYATDKNFVGRPIDGYKAMNVALLAPDAAKALCEVQNDLIQRCRYGLLIYDAYRPRRAVQDFLNWSKMPPANEWELRRKEKHYPHIEKNQLFDRGYISEDSIHCYGNAVDVFLIDLEEGKKLNMGSCYDYMDEKSHSTAGANLIGEEAIENRKILSEAMQRAGFYPYEKEFWHFSYGEKEGHEIKSPMDIEITLEMKGVGFCSAVKTG